MKKYAEGSYTKLLFDKSNKLIQEITYISSLIHKNCILLLLKEGGKGKNQNLSVKNIKNLALLGNLRMSKYSVVYQFYYLVCN